MATAGRHVVAVLHILGPMAGWVMPTGAHAIVPFTEEAFSRGLIYTMQSFPQSDGNEGFGCGFADLDNDGDPEVILLGAADDHVGIFENSGAGVFFDRSFASGIPPLPEASAFVAGDYDGDGDLDLYITRWTLSNVLLRNDGGLKFTDVTAAAGVGDAGEGEAAVYGDYDGDGWLDLYVCNYTGLDLPDPAPRNKLYRNLGDGTFEDVSVAQTVDDLGYGFQAVWTDYDRDGDVDLYLSNDRGHLPPLFQGNQLWRNDGGQLVNVSKGSGADLGLFSMGVACGDFDGNRWPDLYVTNLPSWPGGFNPLFLNQGDGTFVESSVATGVGHFRTSWGSIFFDFDNNTYLDLYVNSEFEGNSLYAWEGAFPCVDIASQVGVQANGGASFGSAFADVDADGDLDLLVNNLSFNVQLFINHEGQLHNWIRYRMVGQGPNHFAIGGNTDTRVGATWQFREIYAGGNSFIAQNELIMHVGLGDAAIADEVVAQWPGGTPTRTLTNLPANYLWTLYPPSRLGDVDGDGEVGPTDFDAFSGCFDQQFAPGCEMMDFDGGSVVDCADWEDFAAMWSGPGEVPDFTPCACPADVNGDGVVDASDLAQLLGSWGPNPGSPADLDGNDVVNASDLALLLGSWGAC